MVVLVAGASAVIERREVEAVGPHDSAVELVDRGSPRVGAERVRVARLWGTFDATRWAPGSREHKLGSRLGRRRTGT